MGGLNTNEITVPFWGTSIDWLDSATGQSEPYDIRMKTGIQVGRYIGKCCITTVWPVHACVRQMECTWVGPTITQMKGGRGQQSKTTPDQHLGHTTHIRTTRPSITYLPTSQQHEAHTADTGLLNFHQQKWEHSTFKIVLNSSNSQSSHSSTDVSNT